MENLENIKAVVQKVIPKGDHGPFAVATSEKIEGSITFSLEPTVWQEKEWPEQGTVILLGKIRRKRAGWRAKTGRFFKPSDEQVEKRNELTNQYRQISAKEIKGVAEEDLTRAMLMMVANANLAEAESKATGEKPYEPEFHKSGWSIAIETPQGVVGLWSCWLDNQFYLGYPKHTSFLISAIPEETVIKMANDFRRNNPKKFFGPVKEEFDLDQSRQLLLGFKDEELVSVFQHHGIEIPEFKDYANVSDDLIMKTLGVERAQPVLQVNACAVNDWNYEGEFKDPDKPLVKNSVGQIVAYSTQGMRLWEKFYGPQLGNKKGRVWIDHSEFNSNSHHFDVITSQGELKSIYYGHDYSRGISTHPFSHYSEYAPEGPSADPEAIQPYRDRFIALACEIARQMGGATAITISYGFVLVPEQLSKLGYENITWLEGRAGIRQGYGKETVRAEKNTESGKEIIILRSGNSLVPWATVRRLPCTADLNTEKILEFLTF